MTDEVQVAEQYFEERGIKTADIRVDDPAAEPTTMIAEIDDAIDVSQLASDGRVSMDGATLGQSPYDTEMMLVFFVHTEDEPTFENRDFTNERWECTGIKYINEHLATIRLQPQYNTNIDGKLNFATTLPPAPDGWEWNVYDGFTVDTDGTFNFSLVAEHAANPHVE